MKTVGSCRKTRGSENAFLQYPFAVGWAMPVDMLDGGLVHLEYMGRHRGIFTTGVFSKSVFGRGISFAAEIHSSGFSLLCAEEPRSGARPFGRVVEMSD